MPWLVLAISTHASLPSALRMALRQGVWWWMGWCMG
jgi:hypothetical protein